MVFLERKREYIVWETSLQTNRNRVRQHIERIQVLRLYLKSLHDNAVYGCAGPLAVTNLSLIETLDKIKNRYKSFENN